MRRFTEPATPFPGRLNHFIIADSLGEIGDFARTSNLRPNTSSPNWDFGLGLEKAIQFCFTGDTSQVSKSDEMLERLEAHIEMPSTRTQWIDDVAGYFPNIPAHLAGVPASMRRRSRQESISAPLAIIVDLSISAGITAAQAQRRGITILALARALSARRPIELWVGDMGAADERAAFGGSRSTNCVSIFTRIETTPLDLASSCYALTHPAFLRQVLFQLEEKYHNFMGGWPFRLGRALKRTEMESLLAPAFPQVTSTLCIPGLHIADDTVNNPEAWLIREIKLHDPLALQDA